MQYTHVLYGYKSIINHIIMQIHLCHYFNELKTKSVDIITNIKKSDELKGKKMNIYAINFV